jgi:hypothetical protein
MTLISFPWLIDDVPTDADSVVFSDAGGDFGLRRTDTEEVLIPAGTALDHDGVGEYSYDLDDPEAGITYEYWIRVVYDGETYHVQNFIDASDGPTVKTLRFVVVTAGAAVVLEDAPVLSNPTGSFGAVRVDTGAIVASDGEEFAASGSLYSVSFTEPAEGLTYRYYVEAVYGGTTYHLPRTTAYNNSAALVIGRYTDSTRIEAQFGVENVAKWLGIDDGDEPVDWALRMDRFIVAAEQQLDDLLRGGPCTVPFEEPAPEVIIDIATNLAAVRMYEARGVVDMHPETGQPQHRLQHQKKQAMYDLARIKAGQLRLTVDDATRFPAVVCDD